MTKPTPLAANLALSYPRVCGLLGSNPSRLSQAMHNAGFKALGLPFQYAAFKTENTNAGLTAMRELGFRGLSLTIPHKEQALGLVDALSKDAIECGAINTVINDGEKLFGYNTDWYGVVEALREAGIEPKRALIFGAGGAARAAVVALRHMNCERILIANRTAKRATDLANVFNVEALAYEELAHYDFQSNVDLFVSAAPVGAEGFPFPLSVFGPGHTVFDMVTKETELLTQARAQGAKVVPGIRMLLHQALKQFELFTESISPREAMEQALAAQVALDQS